MATTTTRGYPFPQDNDPADVPYDVEALAVAVNDSPGITSYTQTEINGLSAGMKWAGRIVWNSTTSTVQRSDGSAFSDLALSSAIPALSTSTPASTAGTGSAGSASTTSKSDHVHALHTHDHSSSTTGANIPQASITGLSSAWTESAATLFNVTLGNGSATQRYVQIGKTVFAHLYLALGTTSTINGEFAWMLPINPVSNGTWTELNMGQALAQDNNTGSYYTATCQANISAKRIYMYHNASTSPKFSASVPFTWASSDKIWASITYEAV